MLKSWFVGVLGLVCFAARADRPNVVVIYTDDQGYGDVGAYGYNEDVKTPHLDQLAKDGVLCTSGYVTAPQCAPSRAGFMTGRHQQRIGFDTIPDGPLPLEEVTIAERLQEGGYTTGHVGKWHLEPNHVCMEWGKKKCPELVYNDRVNLGAMWDLIAEYQSCNQGFDDFYSGEINHYWRNYDLEGNDLKRDGEHIHHPKSEFRIDIQTDAALAFIDRNHKEPFFLYLAYYAPHMPLVATEQYLSRFPRSIDSGQAGEMPERRRYGLAMMAAMDDGVGKIREKLADYGLTENTMIIYTSDNGAPLGAQQGGAKGYKNDVLPVDGYKGAWDGSDNGPLLGEKGLLMEGGIRVPFIVSWPEKLPKGVTCDEPVSTLDIAPTCLRMAGLPIPQIFDGENLLPLLTGKKKRSEPLCWRFWNQAAIRDQNWKYYVLGDGTEYLVDLDQDIAEKENLIKKYPERAEGMRKALEQRCNGFEPKGLPSNPPNDQEIQWKNYYLKD